MDNIPPSRLEELEDDGELSNSYFDVCLLLLISVVFAIQINNINHAMCNCHSNGNILVVIRTKSFTERHQETHRTSLV